MQTENKPIDFKYLDIALEVRYRRASAGALIRELIRSFRVKEGRKPDLPSLQIETVFAF